MAIKTEQSIVTRLRHSGVILIVGFLVITNVALVILYLTQGPKQSEINNQIVSANRLLANPLPSDREMQAQYGEVQASLASVTGKDAFNIIVGIARNSGIDVSPDSSKLTIPSFQVRKEKIGDSAYEVLSFKGIKAQGDQNSLMTLISNLDSGKTYKTMVLKKVSVNQTEVKGGAKEETKIETAVTMDVDIYTKP